MIKKLVEDIDGIAEAAAVAAAASKGDAYGYAAEFFSKGVLPNGSKWPHKIVPFVGFDNDPKISKVERKTTKAGENYSARIRFAPGKGGGAGVSIEPSASDYFFNMLGKDNKAISGVAKAFLPFVKSHSRTLNDDLRRWLKKPENYLHHVVGWANKTTYAIDDIVFKSIRYDNPMIDPSRRLWPAGRTEIWVPIMADVVISVKKK